MSIQLINAPILATYPSLISFERTHTDSQLDQVIQQDLSDFLDSINILSKLEKDKIFQSLTILKEDANRPTIFKFRVHDQQYVMRTFSTSTLQDAKEREIEAMRIASKEGLAPEVLFFPPSSNSFIMQFVEYPIGTFQSFKSDYAIAHLVKALKTLHHLPSESFQKYPSISHFEELHNSFDKLQNKNGHLSNLISFIENAIAKTKELLNQASFANVLIHNDFLPANLFLKDNGDLILIDWESAGYGPVINDLARCLLLFDFSKTQEKQFLKGYFEKELSDLEYHCIRLMIGIDCLRTGIELLSRLETIPDNIEALIDQASTSFSIQQIVEDPRFSSYEAKALYLIKRGKDHFTSSIKPPILGIKI